jgi:sugar phosphate isomerase/epimerase
VNDIGRLTPLEVRYHLFFPGVELGSVDPAGAESARAVYAEAFDLISKVSGRYATAHVGLDRASMEGVSWDGTIAGLRDIEAAARRMGIRLCLENLVHGWTGRPNLYEKLIRKTGLRGTLDIGHAHVCESVASRVYSVEDFAVPHPEKILSAHIYHKETDEGHVPPGDYFDMEERLLLLRGLPLCDWWVLELRNEESLLQTLD